MPYSTSTSREYIRAKARERLRRWRAANPERAREKARRDSANLRARDPERAKKALKKSRLKHIEKRRQEVRDWRAADPEKAQKSGRDSYAKHVEQRQQDARNARAANPGKFRERDRLRNANEARRIARRDPVKSAKFWAWIEANPDYVRFNAWLQKYRRKKAMPLWVDRDELRAVYDNCPPGYQIDHRVPIKGFTPEGYPVCGLHVPWNLQYLTPAENLTKRNRMRIADL